MTKVDRVTQLKIINKYKNGQKISSIRKDLSDAGLNITWDTVKYYVTKYQKGEIDDSVSELSTVTEQPTFVNLTEADLCEIRHAMDNDPTQSATDIQKMLQSRGVHVGLTTVRRAIDCVGYTHAAPRYCQLIRDVNKEKRINFCTQLIEADDKMEDIIFSDESSIQLHQNKTNSYRRKGSMAVHRPKPKHPLKVHVWGAISRRGASQILIFDGIMKSDFFVEDILQNTLSPFIRELYPDHHRFQQDNDPKHKSNLAKNYMADNGINWWGIWPSESPDLNPIEMVWAQMKRHVAKVMPRTKDQLEDVIQNFWNTTMTVALCNRYIDHVYKVAPVCVLLDGKATGDLPSRIFPQSSANKSFRHYSDLLQTPDVQARASSLMPAF